MSKDTNLRTVYDQYWLEARHVEHETWLFNSFYAAIVAGIFAVIGSDLPIEIKISMLIFGEIFSILGFFVVFTLRVPFFKFVLMAELIAINEFKIDEEYRRYFPKKDKAYPKGKYFDTHDVLATFYSSMIGSMTFILLYLCLNDLVFALIGLLLSMGFFLLLHFEKLRGEYAKIFNELKGKIKV